MTQFHRKQKVLFGRPRGQKTLAEVVRVNQKSVTVVTLEPRGKTPSGSKWRAHPSLIQPVEGDVTTPSAPPAPPGPGPTTSSWSVRDRVAFTHKGTEITGMVKQVNPKTVTVIPDEPAYPGQYWRVSPGMLRASDTVAPVGSEAEAVGDPTAASRMEYTRSCQRYGLKPEWLGETFRSGRNEFRVVGLNPRAHKMPVNIVRVRDSRKMKCAPGMVKDAMSVA